LPELLALCAKLTGQSPRFMLLTCHSPGIGPRELKQFLADALGPHARSQIDCSELYLASSDGRQLNCGAFARYSVAT
jgi:23S rRNA (cytosine1962-C5)-methyltransferase